MKAIKKIIAIVLVLATVFCTAAMAESNAKRILTATGNCNLRKGPGLDYGIITVIHKGDKVTMIDEDIWEDDARGVVWYKVKTAKGKTGWASSVYLHESTKEIGLVKTTGNVNIRNKATTKDSKILGSIPKGKTVKCTAIQRDENGTMWFLITYAGKVGWISSKYAVEVK